MIEAIDIHVVLVVGPYLHVYALLSPSHTRPWSLHGLYTKLGFFTPCRLCGGLCRLHDKTGTLPGTSYSLRDKPCSLHVCTEIFWLFKNFHELHMKFDLDIHHVNFMLTSCTLRGIPVDHWLTSCYFVGHFISKLKHEVNVKPTRHTMKYREANK